MQMRIRMEMQMGICTGICRCNFDGPDGNVMEASTGEDGWGAHGNRSWLLVVEVLEFEGFQIT